MTHEDQERDLHESEALAAMADSLGRRRVKLRRNRPAMSERPPRKKPRAARIPRYKPRSLLAGEPVLR